MANTSFFRLIRHVSVESVRKQGRVRRRQVWLEVDQLTGGRDPALILHFGFKLTAFGRREGPRDSVDTRVTLRSRSRIAEFGKGPRGADDRRTHVIRYLFWRGGTNLFQNVQGLKSVQLRCILL